MGIIRCVSGRAVGYSLTGQVGVEVRDVYCLLPDAEHSPHRQVWALTEPCFQYYPTYMYLFTRVATQQSDTDPMPLNQPHVLAMYSANFERLLSLTCSVAG